jgi:hypothetical protein
LRWGEAIALTVADVEFLKGHVARSAAYVREFGG